MAETGVEFFALLPAQRSVVPWYRFAFGVLPPYWAAKAFWIVSEHGTWWPYLLVGVVYNLAVSWPLFRRFLVKNT